MMEHSNIARVLDGGATESGRPYFVMELVKGKTITQYVDANNLTVRERLELFQAVCYAVQHAHQKGIIHRDLKPANIMVTLHDGKPVVKIIDFGIAKALNRELTERTLFTAYGQMVGTPQYMSPEQAEMSGLDVDTRSDIYSLGVLLYELLTGTTPITSEQLRNAGFSQMLKTIREYEPSKPSTRLCESGNALLWILVDASDRTFPAIASCSRRSGLDRDEIRWKRIERVDTKPPMGSRQTSAGTSAVTLSRLALPLRGTGCRSLRRSIVPYWPSAPPSPRSWSSPRRSADGPLSTPPNRKKSPPAR